MREIILQSIFSSAAMYALNRERLAIESQKQFWRGRAAAAAMVANCKDSRFSDLVLKLQNEHAAIPAFEALCENLQNI
jgi:hypothetical protein